MLLSCTILLYFCPKMQINYNLNNENEKILQKRQIYDKFNRIAIQCNLKQRTISLPQNIT